MIPDGYLILVCVNIEIR